MYSSSGNVGTMSKNENSESSFELHTEQNVTRTGTAVSGSESTPLVGGGLIIKINNASILQLFCCI